MTAVCALGVGAWVYQTLNHDDKNRCEAGPYQTDCYIKEIQRFTASGDIVGALKYATETIAPVSRNSLHMTMHVIGRAAYLVSGSHKAAMSFLPQSAFTEEDHLTYDGFQHGVLQALFVEQGNSMNVHDLIKESCGDYWIEKNDPRGPSPQRTGLGCFHGVGHALMALYKNDVQKSIKECVALPYAWMQQRCGYGVYMEASYAFYPSYAQHMHSTHSMRQESMRDLCLTTPSLQEVCAMFVGHSYLMSHEEDYAGSFNTCRTMPENLAKECEIYLAEVIFPGTTRDPEKLKAMCTAAGPSEEGCLLWVAHGLRDGYAGPEGRSVHFCEHVREDITKKCTDFLRS